MNSDDSYSDWKRRRRQVDVDDRFADRIMERIDGIEPVQRRPAAIVAERGSHRFAWRVQVTAAVLVVGLGIGLLRAGFFIVFLLLSTSRGY